MTTILVVVNLVVLPINRNVCMEDLMVHNLVALHKGWQKWPQMAKEGSRNGKKRQKYQIS